MLRGGTTHSGLSFATPVIQYDAVMLWGCESWLHSNSVWKRQCLITLCVSSGSLQFHPPSLMFPESWTSLSVLFLDDVSAIDLFSVSLAVSWFYISYHSLKWEAFWIMPRKKICVYVQTHNYNTVWWQLRKKKLWISPQDQAPPQLWF